MYRLNTLTFKKLLLKTKMEEIKKEWRRVAKKWEALPKGLKISSYLTIILLAIVFLPSPSNIFLYPLIIIASLLSCYLALYVLIETIKALSKTIKAILWETKETIRFLKSLKIANFSFKNNSFSFTLFYRPRRREKPPKK